MAPKPTSRQLNYLRSLANRTGQTFTYPTTAQQASAEINRLKHTRPSSRTDVRIERKQIADAIATGAADSSRIRDHEIHGHGSTATWVQNRDQEPTVPADPGPSERRPKPNVGERTELARYTVPAGERIIWGQRVDGVVSFLPEAHVLLDSALGSSDNSGCCPREALQEDGSPNAARQKRANGDGGQAAAADAATTQRGRTGPRVELARYSVTAGDRVLYGQRVDGVVRLTDVPLEAEGRAYLVERGLEEEGTNANAALHALIADYLRQASVLDAVPMAAGNGRR